MACYVYLITPHRINYQGKEVNQLRTRLAVLEQEVKDKGDVVRRTSDLLGTEQEQKVLTVFTI